MFKFKYRVGQMAPDEGAEGGTPADASNEGMNPAEGEVSQGGDGGEGQGKWQDNWRETYAGEDESKLNRLSRYATPAAAFDALFAAQDRIRSGELRAPFPNEGTEDEQNAWRKENGLPDTPDGYSLEFDSGLVVGDDDKEYIDDYLKIAHAQNETPEQVKANLQWYYDNMEKQNQERQELDLQVRQQTNDELRLEWGAEYRAHKNSIQGLMDTMPEEIREQAGAARMPDGTPLFSSPDFLKWMLNTALEINPASTLIPGGGGDIAGSIEDEIKAIESKMGTKEYYNDNKMQQRLRDLYDAREKHGAKA